MKSIFTLIVALSAMLFSCSSQKAESAKDITVSQALNLISSTSDLQLIDVRTPEEWGKGVLDNAIKINIKDADFKEKVSKLSKDKPTLVYCKKGGRSAKATQVLEGLGFTSIYNMLGGYDAYLESTK